MEQDLYSRLDSDPVFMRRKVNQYHKLRGCLGKKALPKKVPGSYLCTFCNWFHRSKDAEAGPKRNYGY